MRKGKQTERVSYQEKIIEICPELSREDIILHFAYNLHPTDPTGRCKGIVAVSREELIVIRDGEVINRIPHSCVESLQAENGVGSCTVAYKCKSDGEYHLLCRMDMSLGKKALHASKRFNRISEGVGFASYDPSADPSRRRKNDENGGRCPKCGRMTRRGICVHCTNKFATLKRLWGMVKPYKLLIILSVIFFFVVSAMNLVLPEINKIVTDDYINSADPEGLSEISYLLVILSMLLVQVLIRAVSMFRSHLLINASNGLIVDLRNMLFAKIQKLSIAKISSPMPFHL